MMMMHVLNPLVQRSSVNAFHDQIYAMIIEKGRVQFGHPSTGSFALLENGLFGFQTVPKTGDILLRRLLSSLLPCVSATNHHLDGDGRVGSGMLSVPHASKGSFANEQGQLVIAGLGKRNRLVIIFHCGGHDDPY